MKILGVILLILLIIAADFTVAYMGPKDREKR